MTVTLQKALKRLETADNKYFKTCVRKYGRFVDDTKLYITIVGPAWRKYLAAGGSRTMINLNRPALRAFY